jgi:hypothetical protein
MFPGAEVPSQDQVGKLLQRLDYSALVPPTIISQSVNRRLTTTTLRPLTQGHLNPRLLKRPNVLVDNSIFQSDQPDKPDFLGSVPILLAIALLHPDSTERVMKRALPLEDLLLETLQPGTSLAITRMSSLKPGEGDTPGARKRTKRRSGQNSRESVNNTHNGMENSGSPHAPTQRDRYEALNEHLANLHQSKKAQTNSDRLKKSLNVESPSFTPSTLSVPNKTSAISSQAANAAPFTPRSMTSGTATPNTQPDTQPTFNPAQIREFTPQHYDLSDAVSCLLHSLTFPIIRSARNYTHHSLLTTS